MSGAPESAEQQRGQRLRLLVFIAVSAPLALGLESTIRSLLFPPEFEELRAAFGPNLAMPAWVCVGLTVVLAGVGFWLQRQMCGRALHALVAGELSEKDRRRLDGFGPEKSMSRMVLDKLFLTTSLPQVPALLATMFYMFGAPFPPVGACMLVSSLAVVGQALSVERQIAAARPRLSR